MISKINQLVARIKYKLFVPPYIKRLNRGLFFPKSYTEYTEYHTEEFSLKWDWAYAPPKDLYKLSNIRKICLCGFEYTVDDPNICPICKKSAITKEDEIELLMLIDKSIYLKFTHKPYNIEIPDFTNIA